MGQPVTQHTPDMGLLVLLGLAATATALPAYVHEEIPAEPYVHIEPPIDDLTLGIIRPNQQQQVYQQPQQQVYQQPQQYFQQPQQPAGYANGPGLAGASTTSGREWSAGGSSKKRGEV